MPKKTSKKTTKKKTTRKKSKKTTTKKTSKKTTPVPAPVDTSEERHVVARRNRHGRDPKTKLKAVAAAAAFTDLSARFPDRQEIEYVSSGCFVFDRILSGGLPLGKYLEIRSDSGLGKSTGVLDCASHLCSQGMGVLHLDTELAATESLITGLGLDQHYGERYFPHQVSTFREAEEILEAYLPWEGRDKGIRLVVVDSITGLRSSKLTERSVEDGDIGSQARHQSLFLQKYKGLAAMRNCTFWFINQIRTKFKTLPGGRMEAYQDSSGSRAFEYYMDARIEMKRKRFIYEGDKKKADKIGLELEVKTFKSRLGLPERKGFLAVLFGKGIDNVRAYMHYLPFARCVTLSGSWYTVHTGALDEPRFQGIEALEEWILHNQDVCWRLLDENGFFA